MDAEKRILQERENWRKDRPFGYMARPRTNADSTLDLFHWDCSIPGPENSPFFGHELRLSLRFFNTYPIHPPEAKFTDKVYHPNVYEDGYICLDVLAAGWKPSMNIKSTLLAICDLMENPNPASSANMEASNMFVKDATEYEMAARAVLEAGKRKVQ